MCKTDAPTLFKVALSLSIIGCYLHILGMSTTYWSSEGPFGVWNIPLSKGLLGDAVSRFASAALGKKRSIGGVLDKFGSAVSGTVDKIGSAISGNKDELAWLKATQAFVILGLLAGLAAVILTMLYVCSEKQRTSLINILAIVGNFVAAGFILIAVAVYGAHSGYLGSLDWSFYLCVTGMILHIIAGILLLAHKLQNK